MARLAVAAITLGLMLAPATATAQIDSRVGAPPIAGMPAAPMPMPRMQMPPMRGGSSVGMPHGPMPGGPVAAGRWGQVPGGWNAYRLPTYGFALPSYWIAPSFYISNWSSYGLPRPAYGFGWSRYYDDMVLTDQWGRVYDWRDGRDYRGRDNRGEDYSDSYGYSDGARRHSGNDGVTGAVVGGVVGGVAGNLIGGRGNRLAGTLIGGGIGALAGQAINKSSRHHHRDRDFDRDDRFGGDRGPHWIGGFHGGGGSSWGYGGSETVTTVTTVTTPYCPPKYRQRVSYVTEYLAVPVRQRVLNRAKRTKDILLGS